MSRSGIHGKKSESYFGPIVAAIPAFLTQIIAGVLEGEASVLAYQLLNDKESPIIVTEDEVSWIACLGFVLTPITAVLSRPIMDTFGRKCNLYLFFILSTFGFLSVSVASTSAHFFLGRTLSSAAYGLSFSSYNFVAETCAEGQRGQFLFALSLMRPFGLLVVYTIGAYLPWSIASMAFVVTSHIGLLYVFHIPQSPIWLVNQGRFEEAASSLKWLRNDHDSIEQEIASMKTANMDEEFQQKAGMAAFFQSAVYKPFLAFITYGFLQQATGLFAILSYAHEFLRSIGTSIDPSIILIAMASCRILTVSIWNRLAKTLALTKLTFVTAFGAGCAVLTAAACHFAYSDIGRSKDHGQVALVALCVTYTLIGSGLDAKNMPVDLRSVFQPQVLGAARAGIKAANYSFVFICIKFYPFILKILGLPHFLFFLGVSSFAFGIHTRYMMPKFMNKVSTESNESIHMTKLQLTTYL